MYNIVATLTKIYLYVSGWSHLVGPSLKSKYIRHSFTVSLFDVQNNMIENLELFVITEKIAHSISRSFAYRKNFEKKTKLVNVRYLGLFYWRVSLKYSW